MKKTQVKVCAFCGQKAGGQLGSLKNPEESIFAHHNCLIFSPKVTTKNSKARKTKFDIQSVLEEIKRGKTLKCSYCKNKGATIGCDVKRCKKTYHYECVRRDQGITDSERFIVWCSKHATHSKNAQGTNGSETPHHSSLSDENDVPEESKRKSEPGSSQGANKKGSATQDAEQSKSSEAPSTSRDNKTLKRNRTSSPRVYSVQPKNKRSKATQETESPTSSSSEITTLSTSESPTLSHSEVTTSSSSEIMTLSSSESPTLSSLSSSHGAPDKEASTNEASNSKTTVSPSSVKTPVQHCGAPKKKTPAPARPQSKPNASTDVDSKGISDGNERKEKDTQTRSMEEETSTQSRSAEMEISAQAESTEDASAVQGSSGEQTTPLSPHTLNNLCIPSTSHACGDKSEAYFVKLYESQCRIADSIESGIREFQNFIQQLQNLSKQFLDICQFLNHDIRSNSTDAREQNAASEGHQRQDGTPATLQPIQHSAHSPAFIHESASSAQNGETPSLANTAEQQPRKACSIPIKKKFR